jgi:hypothetical protein
MMKHRTQVSSHSEEIYQLRERGRESGLILKFNILSAFSLHFNSIDRRQFVSPQLLALSGLWVTLYY